MLDRVLKACISIPAFWLVAAVFLLSAGETAFLLGFVIPGELTVFLGGVLASRAHVPLPAVLAASILGPILGDSIGYFLGRRYGENVSHRHRRKGWASARHWIKTKAAPAG